MDGYDLVGPFEDYNKLAELMEEYSHLLLVRNNNTRDVYTPGGNSRFAGIKIFTGFKDPRANLDQIMNWTVKYVSLAANDNGLEILIGTVPKTK